MADIDTLIAEVLRLDACRRSSLLRMGGPEALMDAAPILAAEVKRLRAELEKARLALAAERGDQEGAPHPDWRAEGRAWCRVYADGTRALVSAAATWCRGPGGDIFATHGKADNQRAAMQAADRANP